jgi:copper resistance protein D
VTGSINTWYLADNALALTDTDYGRLLLTKIALFFGMVAIAAINRLHFTPRLVQAGSAFAAQDALRQLHRNAVIEVVIGIVIICASSQC